MTHGVSRKTPDELLSEVQAEETRAIHRGHLKLFLGYASGVGKTYRMLAEALRRTERGQDVVVGAVQEQAPPEARQLLSHLEIVPMKSMEQGGAIDVDALLRRRPAICIVDGLAYDNPPGSRNQHRWQDVRELVAAGIKVISSINIQYVQELREGVQAITGKHVTQTVPVEFIRRADEIEIVDVPLDACDDPAGEQTGRANRLAKLREMTLVLAADVVDKQLSAYLESQGIRQRVAAQERVLICVTPRANVDEMLLTAQVIVERFHGELLAAYVRQEQISARDEALLEEKIATLRHAGTAVEILEGDDPIKSLLAFAHTRGITQIFVGHTQRTGLWARLRGSPVEKLIRASRDIEVRIFPH